MTAPARVTGRRAPARRPAPRRTPGSPRHLEVVRPATRRRRMRLTAVAALAVTLFAVFGVVSFNVFIVQSQFRLERIEADIEAERAEYERLRLQEARLSSPERVLALARERLGMVEPAAITYLTAPARGPVERDGTPASHAVQEWAEVKPIVAAEP